jgi:polyvinyl alcohol dehydrogenase (cytochrome)
MPASTHAEQIGDLREVDMRAVATLLILYMLSSSALAEEARDATGEALFRAHCAKCHNGSVIRAPDAAALRQLPAAAIKAALTSGSMSAQGQGLSAADIDAVSRFLGNNSAPVASAGAACTKTISVPADAFAEPHWNGWGVDAAQRRFQPAAMAELAAADVPKLKLKWAFGFDGVNRAYAQPTIVAGRLFIGSADGKIYSLDAKTGCVIWVFDTSVPVRTAISIGVDARGWSVYFGDQRANAYALDALTGTLRWITHVDDHTAASITGAPALVDRVLYVPVTSYEEVTGADPHYPCCTFRGSIAALDTATGKVLWKGYSIAEAPKPVRTNQVGVQLFGPSGAAIWSSPAVDPAGGMLYATTGDSYSDPPAATSDAFLAFRLDKGEQAWSRQMTAGDAYNVACARATPGVPSNCPEANGPDFDFGSSPILVQLANDKRALIAGQKSGVVYAIDPDRQGAIIWQRRVGEGGRQGGVEWGAAVDERNVYVALSDVRKRPVPDFTAGAQKSFSGQSFLLDPAAGGGLFALALETGDVVWHTPHPGCGDAPGCSPAQSAAVTAIPGVVFSGGLDGHLRAYDATTGRIIWDVDTKGTYDTVNGTTAIGGSLDGPGPVVVGGMLYVNSGYAFLGGAPGNVLLAFSVGGK